MKKKKILITDRFAVESLAWLSQKSQFEIVKADSPSHLPLEHLVAAHALLIRSRTLINEELLQKARQLQVIISATSGFDHIDLNACTKWGITVMHTPSANIESAAQLTWSLVLASACRLRESRRLIESGDWLRDEVIGLELSGRTYAVIGLGRIGKRVARLAQAFGMNVVAHDPYVDEATFESLQIQKLNFEEALRTADVVSFHVPKTQETEGMLQKSAMEKLPRGLIVVNTSRGSVIAEKDLLEAISKGWIKAAGLDVFEQEPLSPASPLLRHPQIVLTPHTGANTEEAFFKASQLAAEKVSGFFLDGSTSDTLPPRVPWYGATKAD